MITVDGLHSVLDKAKVICDKDQNLLESENVILTLFLTKYLTDIYKTLIFEIESKDISESEKVDAKARIKLDMKKEFSFDYFNEHKDSEDIAKIISNGIYKMENSMQNFIRLFGVFKLLDFLHVRKKIEHTNTKTLCALIELFSSLDLTGKEEVDLFGLAFKYCYKWSFSTISFRRYIGA
ncbi:MAG: SAM-dependent DNA methyltransferase [Clostridia bacterium]|nr:SAM-dependent DNA methyltransferase [Clostridia bacterium]